MVLVPDSAPEMVPVPGYGRTFTAKRRVRWGDTDPSGRLRLDALARYLQDVANDDTRDAGHDPSAPWVVRRTTVVVHEQVALGEMVSLTTFSGGHGSRWAERRTSVVGERGGHVEVAALWVYVDPKSGRPARLTAEFHATYDEAAAGRQVSARLHHPVPPGTGSGERPGIDERNWPLRATDLDMLGHVNNAATWAAVEQELAEHSIVPRFAEIEYHDGIDADDSMSLLTTHEPDGLHLWLEVGGEVRASAVVRQA